MHKTYIESLGVYLPPGETPSAMRVAGIRSGIKFPLEQLTGIVSTRTVGEGEFSFDLACRAIENSLAKSHFTAADIGAVIACNISKYDRAGYVFSIEPNTASSLCSVFGFANALAFDVNNACTGMFTGILVADALLHQTDIRAAIVVSGEYISHLADTAQREITSMSDPRLPCLTLGDAGAAVVLARTQDPATGFHHIEGCTLGAYSDLCTAYPSQESDDGAIMHTDIKLLRVGIVEGARHMVHSMRAGGWDVDSVDHVIGHFVSQRVQSPFIEIFNEAWGTGNLTAEKSVHSLMRRGNTASTGHFVALHDNIENGRIDAGDRVVFNFVGSGLSLGTALYDLGDLPSRLRNGGASHPLAAAGVIVANGAANQDNDTLPPPSGAAIASVAVTHSPGNSVSELVLEAPPPRPRNGSAYRSPPVAGVVAANGAANRGDAILLRQPARAAIASVAVAHSPGKAVSDLVLEAAEACLDAMPGSRGDIGTLLFTGVYKPGHLAEPSYASILAGALFSNTGFQPDQQTLLAFDLHSGPNGFLAACDTLRCMMRHRAIRAGLVVAVEYDGNRTLSGYPRNGIAQVASAAVINNSDTAGAHIENCKFFSFNEHESSFRAEGVAAKPKHVSIRADERYEALLRRCICDAIGRYLVQMGRSLDDFDEFWLPQTSSCFLDRLASALEIRRDRVIDVTLPEGDLYTSSVPFLLDRARRTAVASATKKRCLVVTAGPGIHVACAVVSC